MWWQLVISVGLAIYSYANRPKSQHVAPPGIDDVKAPRAEVGAEIPVIFGRVEVENPNVLDFFGVRITEIKKAGGKK